MNILGFLGSVAILWLVFFEKNFNEITNLDQKTCRKSNESEAREKQHNQLMIQNQQLQAQRSHTIQALQQQQPQILPLLMQRQ